MNASASGRLSVLIPVYNEEKTVEQVLRRVLALGECLKEIVVVDDGSQDNTARIVETLRATRVPTVFRRTP